MRRVIFYSFCLFFILAAPTASHAAWWDFFFPNTGPDPRQTLRAPFADADAVIIVPEGESVKTLSVRHFPATEISKWLELRVSDLVVYSARAFQEEYKDKTKDFDSFGKAEYLKFLQDELIFKTLSSGKYDVKGFAMDAPVLLNEGVISGRYRWLFQVPVMVTFVPSGIKDYKMAEKENMANIAYKVNLQVGRSDIAQNEFGVFIEAWKATPLEDEKKIQN